MTLREFFRFHLLKVLLGLVALQLIVLVIIQNYNHRPLAQKDQTEVIEDRTVRISPLLNDSDKDKDDELSIENISSPLNGTTEQKENMIYYTPNSGFSGLDSLAYTITDGKKESSPAYIVIQVNKNQAPVTGRDLAEVYSGGGVMINVLGNDYDNEGDSIYIADFTKPLNGKVQLIGNKFAYVANNTSAKADSFVYVANDGKSSSTETTVFITIRSKGDSCYPWLSSDIGDAALPGSLSCSAKKFTVVASGSDIWNNRDGFRYVYQYINGDCEMLTKVESLDGTNEWAKAGLMIRESLDGDAKMAFVCVTNRNGIATHQRLQKNEGAEGGEGQAGLKAPYWVKIKRHGDTFTYSMSANGQDWKSLGSADVSMTKNVYIGLAVTSHNNGETCTAVFSNSAMTGRAIRFKISE